MTIHGLRRDGDTVVHKYGYNKSIPNGSYEGLLSLTGAFPWLQAASTVRIKAGGNAADDAGSSPQGAGARAIVVQGLDGAGAEVEETIITAGAAASVATTTTFMRVFRAWVSAAGEYTGVNTAAIVVQVNSAASPEVDLIEIPAGEGQSQHCAYTIPAGKTGYLASFTVQADGLKAADFRVYTRAAFTTVTPPYEAKRVRFYMDGILGVASIKPETPIMAIPALTDIWMEASGGGAGTEAVGDMEIIIVNDY